jgi:hypothetical protein
LGLEAWKELVIFYISVLFLKNSIVRLEAGETKSDEPRTVYLDDELTEVFEKQ